MESRIEELSKYRYESCMEAISEAKLMYDNGHYKNALNRGYYAIFHAIFHAMRSVTALDSYDSSKHSGVIAYFNQHYVKTGLFPAETSAIIKLASAKRERADYYDFYVASKDEASEQIQRAITFAEWTGNYLTERGVSIFE